MGVWRTAPFRRAPLLLRRHLPVAGAVAGAAAVLALTGAAAPLFVDSAASASVNNQVTARCPATLGFAAFSATARVGSPKLTAARPDFERLSRNLNLSPTVVTTIYGASQVPIFLAAGDGTVDYPISLMRREGQEDNITILADRGGPGLLLPDTFARALHVKAGDRVRLSSADARTLPVAAVYRDLDTEPHRLFWCDPILRAYSKGLLDENPPPPLVLARGRVLDDALRGTTTPVVLYDNRALRPGMTLPVAREVSQGLTGARRDLRHGYAAQRDDRGKPLLYRTGTVNDLPFIVDRSDAVASSLSATCTAIAAAGSVVALLLLGGAGRLWVERRRTEVALLSARGIGPLALGAKALAEMALPVLAGSAAGWALALWLVPAVGPSDILPSTAAGDAALRVLPVAAAGALTLLAVAALAIRHGTERPLGHRRSRLAAVPWELGLLVAAWLTYRSIADRGLPLFADTTIPRLDAAQLLYPMLLLSGGTLLLARCLVLLLRRRRGRGSGRGRAGYLAGRRLAGAPLVTAVLVVAAALAVGVLTFATAVTSTLRYSVETKARLFVGSAAQVTLVHPLRHVPPALAGTATSVVSTDANPAGVGHVDLLGVDPSTFAAVATWDDRLAGPSLPSLLDRIRSRAAQGGDSSGTVPALAVGDVPENLTLPLVTLGGQLAHLRVQVVARPSAFPQQGGYPMIVVDRAAMSPRVRALAANEVWLRHWDESTRAALHDAGAQIRFVTTVADVSRVPDLDVVTWTYGFFTSLGALTGLIAVGGLLLYLATRARARALSYGLTLRMGLRRRAHALSTLLEVGFGLLAGYLIGTGLGTVGVVLVYSHLDPEGNLPPRPLLHLPPLAYLALAAATLAVALAATGLAQRTADRTRMADLLRLGTG